MEELLDSALHVSLSPLESSRVSPELEGVLPSLTVLEPHYRSISLDVHQASTRLNFLAGEATNLSLIHI